MARFITIALVACAISGCSGIDSASSRVPRAYTLSQTGTASDHAGTLDSSSRAFAAKFYNAVKSWSISGIPSGEDIKRVQGYFSQELIQTFERIDKQRLLQPEFNESGTPLKPYWTREGERFSDNWEGFTRFTIGGIRSAQDAVFVDVTFYYEPTGVLDTTPWINTLILLRESETWVVSDIAFVRRKTTFRTELEKLIEEVDDVIKSREQLAAPNPDSAP